MRIVVGVVVLAAAVLGTAAARAEEPGTPSCAEACEKEFDACSFRTGIKQPGACATRLIECKRGCPGVPALGTAPPPPRSCREACEARFEECTRRRAVKHAGTCPTELMGCRQACPPEPPPAVTAAAGTVANAASVPAGEKAPPVGEVTRAAGQTERAGTPSAAPPAAPARDAAPAPPASVPVVVASEQAAAPSGASPRVTVPPRAEESAFRRFWCAINPFCSRTKAPAAPRSCAELCDDAYDACLKRASKRAGECQTNVLVCKKRCGTPSP